MDEISLQQVYDLTLEVSRSAERLESSVDAALLEARALRQEMDTNKQLLRVLATIAEGFSHMKSAVLVFPGINRERDMARALKLASGNEAVMVWHAETSLPKGTDLVVVPGGFSYGDYLRCGAIAARAPVMDAVRDFAAKGGLVLGVCNGFQILCEAGLLPGVLMRNSRLKFICRDVHLRVERSDTPFTRGYNAGQVIRVPVAHGEGNYEADEETVKRLEGEGRVLYRYCSPEGVVDEASNINGAAESIAGIVNERGNVLGMMPHPENHVEDIMGCTDGRGLFAGLVAHLDRAA